MTERIGPRGKWRMQKLRTVLLTMALVVAASMSVLVTTAGPALADDVCSRHDHTPNERVWICAGIRFRPPAGSTIEGVVGTAWMYTNTSRPNVQIDQIRLYRVGGVLISTCTGDGNCPQNGQNGYIDAETDVHGPCRYGQAYYARAYGRVRWSDGTLSQQYEVKSISDPAIIDCV